MTAARSGGVEKAAARYAELDRLLRGYIAITAGLVAVIGALVFRHYGPVFVISAMVPLAFQVTRLVVSGPIALYRWAQAFALVVAICVVVGSLEAGGAQSAVLLFSVPVGQVVSTAFPNRFLWNLLPVSIVGSVVLLDWLAGGIDGDALMPTTAFIIAATTPIFARKSLDLELMYRERANMDSLTGCLNRSSLGQRLSELVVLAEEAASPFGVIAIDVDHFKRINDRFSHQVGDQALIGIAEVVRQQLRQSDMLFRTGGEEFTVLVPSGTHEQCLKLAERIRSQISEAAIIDAPITVSVGVARGSASGLDSALHLADQALYEAKRAGRNQVVG